MVKFPVVGITQKYLHELTVKANNLRNRAATDRLVRAPTGCGDINHRLGVIDCENAITPGP